MKKLAEHWKQNQKLKYFTPLEITGLKTIEAEIRSKMDRFDRGHS